MTPQIRPRRIVGRAAAAGLLFAGVVCLVLVSACTSRQEILLHSDGSGSVQFRVVIAKSLMDAASGLSQGAPTSASPGEFDIPAIRAVFAKNDSLTLESLDSPSAGVLSGSFTFSDVGRLFHTDTGGTSDVITYSRGPSGNSLKVHITRTNFAEIATLAGMTSNPLYQMFG
ncbi:MAG TPA: hypothetical protein VMW69_02740, partial [Spirochaetia bacterium]|nr:hypothetical protein [Spirochaetia bacterium]